MPIFAPRYASDTVPTPCYFSDSSTLKDVYFVHEEFPQRCSRMKKPDNLGCCGGHSPAKRDAIARDRSRNRTYEICPYCGGSNFSSESGRQYWYKAIRDGIALTNYIPQVYYWGYAIFPVKLSTGTKRMQFVHVNKNCKHFPDEYYSFKDFNALPLDMAKLITEKVRGIEDVDEVSLCPFCLDYLVDSYWK